MIVRYNRFSPNYNQPASMESSRSDDLTTGFRMIGFIMSLWRAFRQQFVLPNPTRIPSLALLLLSSSLPPLPSLSLSLYAVFPFLSLFLCLSLVLSLSPFPPISPSVLLSLPFFHALLPNYVSHSLTHPTTHPLSLSLSLFLSLFHSLSFPKFSRSVWPNQSSQAQHHPAGQG